MHHTQSEKMEIIRLVEQSDTGVIRTLKDLKGFKSPQDDLLQVVQRLS